jgi:hypothetical protein
MSRTLIRDGSFDNEHVNMTQTFSTLAFDEKRFDNKEELPSLKRQG